MSLKSVSIGVYAWEWHRICSFGVRHLTSRSPTLPFPRKPLAGNTQSSPFLIR